MKKYLFLLFLLAFIPFHAHAAIGFDASSSMSTTTAVSSLTWSHSVAGGNKLLIVTLTGGAQTTGVTFNTVAMSLVQSFNTAQNATTSMWCLVNPATGLHNIVATFATAGSQETGFATSYTGVNQSCTLDKVATSSAATGTSFPMTITPVSDNAWIIGVANTNQNTAPSAGTATTIRGTVGLASTYNGAMYDNNAAVSPAAATTITVNGASGFWAGIIVAIAPVSASPARRRQPIIL